MLTAIIDLHSFAAEYLKPETIAQVLRIALIVLIGFPLIKILTKVTGRVIRDKFSPQSEMLIKRSVYYLGVIIILITVMNELGFKISALLGAAGILGIAIGFASQTSVSNIISGIFLISEKPFTIGDIIQINDTIGYVISVDLLSVKVKTFDYRFVRIPNENMIKTEIVNLTRFESRRVNLNISVAYKDNLNKVIEVLKDVAQMEPLALKEPEPTIQINQFADSGISIMFGVWGKTEDFVDLKNALLIRTKERFEAEGIEIPYPHMILAYKADSSLPVKATIEKESV